MKRLGGEAGYDVIIRHGSHGIPHILARDFGSMGYGYGYAFARENVCTIAEQYVTARGERSRFFGPEGSWTFEGNGAVQNNLNSDFFYTRINQERTIEKLLAQPPPHGPRPEIREGVRGYVAGYNRYLRDTGVDKLPDDACRGKPWVRPIEEIDAYRRFYQLASLASSGIAIDGIGGAAPLTPPLSQAASPRELPADLGLGGAGSNAYGLGKQATRSGRGMVLGNPHFPWQGSERFFQSHLTIPGKVDVVGAGLFGVPIVLIGHTQRLAWSHTVSTSRRFTVFEEKLVPGSPTTYLHDGQPRQMKADRVTVKARTASGGLEDRSRTLYSTHHGPMFTSLLGLPVFPWSATTGFSLGDVNAQNFRYLNHFFEVNMAQSVRELDAIERRYQGIPWVNTIAADSRGEAYYTDIGATPHVTNAHAERCNTAIGRGTFAALRVAVLDGSRSDCEWGRDPDAIQPGSLGPRRQPHLFRDDYVTNSNDSHWLSNPKQPLEGFDLIVGDERTQRSLRTRLGLIMVQQRLAGRDGLPGNRFTLDQLQDITFNNRVYAGELFRDAAVRMCEEMPDVRDACPVLRAWDLRDDLDSRGSVLFRRFATRVLASTGGVVPPPAVFSEPFSPSDPVHTPRGLNTSNPAVRKALSDAVAELRDNGIPLDARLREYQSELRGADRIPIHGGPSGTGVFNVITAPFRGSSGFPDIVHGSSFVMTAEMTPRCPESRSILTYSQAATNRHSRYLRDQSRLYAGKRWVDMRFCPEEVVRDRELWLTELGCLVTSGFRSARVRGRSGRLRMQFSRRLPMPVSMLVVRAADGKRVGHFRERNRSFTWPRRLRAGRYGARFSILSESGKLDTRRVAFRIRRGRVVRAARYDRRAGCGMVARFALSRPAFRRALLVAYRVNRRARVSLALLRGRRVVRRYRTRVRRDGRLYRVRVNGRGLRRGAYRFRLTVRAGKRRARSTLFAVRR